MNLIIQTGYGQSTEFVYTIFCTCLSTYWWQGNKLYQNAYTIYFSRPSSLSMIKTLMAPCRNMNVMLYI